MQPLRKFDPRILLDPLRHLWQQKGVSNYVGRVKEPSHTIWRHSNFYIGLHGRDWVESLEFFAEETEELMRLSPHKWQNYQQGQKAARLIDLLPSLSCRPASDFPKAV